MLTLRRAVPPRAAVARVTVDKQLAPVGAVVVGVGLAGSIVAAELTKAGIDVVGLERGPDRSAESSELVRKHDELRFRIRCCSDRFPDFGLIIRMDALKKRFVSRLSIMRIKT